MSTQNAILENDTLTLATDTANFSTDNAVRLTDPQYQMGSAYVQHVYNLLIAYNELDVLVESVGVSHEVTGHAKSLYNQVYNFSDFEDRLFQHDILVAACVHIACCEQNQRRTMGEVFKSTHATTRQMLSVYETLKEFLAVPPNTRRLLSEEDKRLLSAYKEIDSSSDSISIPRYASHYAKRLYKTIHDSGSFRDQDQKPMIGRTFKSLEAFFAAENMQKATETPQGTFTRTSADAHSTDRVVHTLQELTEQLNLEAYPESVNRRNAVVQASFAPTVPTPASLAIALDEDLEMDTSTVPTAPFAATMAYAFHDSGDTNTICTLPPTAPVTVAGRKKTRAMQNTLYNVICCQCKKILNLQNIHYAFYCLNCKHKRCDNCTMQAI